MISTLAAILQNTTRTVQNWKKEKRPVISLLEKYFTREELQEYLKTGQIEKQEIVKKFSGEELKKKLFTKFNDETALIEYIEYNIDLKKAGIFNSNLKVQLNFFKYINETIGIDINQNNAKLKILEFIEKNPIHIFPTLKNETLNPLNKKQLMNDLDKYYSSIEIYVLITRNINLKKDI